MGNFNVDVVNGKCSIWTRLAKSFPHRINGFNCCQNEKNLIKMSYKHLLNYCQATVIKY